MYPQDEMPAPPPPVRPKVPKPPTVNPDNMETQPMPDQDVRGVCTWLENIVIYIISL